LWCVLQSSVLFKHFDDNDGQKREIWEYSGSSSKNDPNVSTKHVPKGHEERFMVSWERRRVLLHISPHTIEYLYEWKRTMNPPKRSQHTLTEGVTIFG